jgi:hypothetical protein
VDKEEEVGKGRWMNRLGTYREEEVPEMRLQDLFIDGVACPYRRLYYRIAFCGGV